MTTAHWILPGDIGEQILVYRWPAAPAAEAKLTPATQIRSWLTRWLQQPSAQAALRDMQLQLASLQALAGDQRQQPTSLALLAAAFESGELRAFVRPLRWAPLPFEQEEHKHIRPVEHTFIEIKLVDQHGNPQGGEHYRLTLPDGRVRNGQLDNNGFARVTGIEPGVCDVSFPKIDGRRWRRKA